MLCLSVRVFVRVCVCSVFTCAYLITTRKYIMISECGVIIIIVRIINNVYVVVVVVCRETTGRSRRRHGTRVAYARQLTGAGFGKRSSRASSSSFSLELMAGHGAVVRLIFGVCVYFIRLFEVRSATVSTGTGT